MMKRTLRLPSTARSRKGKAHQKRSPAPYQYPFSAIVGQEEMKLALMLNAVDPSIGGVLIMGHRGTGKSTAIRGLAGLLPQIKVVVGCAYRCDPANEANFCSECQRKSESGEPLSVELAHVSVVDLPLGATEDRVCGTVDIERALKQGIKIFDPGLLARANRGLLYIDEVNLLDDHLVDVLLDVAVTGVNKVEREGISIEHPARFVLIGSGNPEEGELRPQLLDRFGLHVEVTTDDDLDRRVEIVERRNAFETAADDFCVSLAEQQAQLRRKIVGARKNFSSVLFEHSLLRQVAKLCTELKIEGHRGELTITRAGRALAAFEGRKKVTAHDVRRVSPMALRHRMRRDPLEEKAGSERIQQALDSVFPQQGKQREPGCSGEGGSATSAGETAQSGLRHQDGAEVPRSRGKSAGPDGTHGLDSPAVSIMPPTIGIELPEFRSIQQSETARPRPKSSRVNSRTTAGAKQIRFGSQRGRYARATTRRTEGARVALDATLRASASAGYGLPRSASGLVLSFDGALQTPSLRYKQLSRKSGRLYIFAIDASGSMAVNRIRQAKEAALALLKQSYVKRDRVAIVGFRGTSAQILLPPSGSMVRARRVLDSMGVGGGTPLSAGLIRSLDAARQDRSEREVFLLIFTDGNANVAAQPNTNASRPERQEIIGKELACLGSALRKARIETFIVDSSDRYVSNGDALTLAKKLGSNYLTVKRSNY